MSGIFSSAVAGGGDDVIFQLLYRAVDEAAESDFRRGNIIDDHPHRRFADRPVRREEPHSLAGERTPHRDPCALTLTKSGFGADSRPPFRRISSSPALDKAGSHCHIISSPLTRRSATTMKISQRPVFSSLALTVEPPDNEASK